MTLLQQLLTSLAAKENPTAKELMDASRTLEQIANIAYMEEFGHPEAADALRKRMREAERAEPTRA